MHTFSSYTLMQEQKMKGSNEITIDYLFELTMKRKWDDVVEVYRSHPWAHAAKLTKSEETAFHLAVSRYHSDEMTCYECCIMEMISCFPDDKMFNILSMPNDKGNTPLHLAAAVGCEAICYFIASKSSGLITLRNFKGETPLFVAAYHGKLKAFLCLHEIYTKERDSDDSLCRRDDGNTILHSSISGEYFRLAYQVISYYPKLVNSVNADGESPLHVLAKKPNVFKSSSHFGIYDSIVYHCVSVEELKKQKYVPRYRINDHRHTRPQYPDNYRTCANLVLLLLAPIYLFVKAAVVRGTHTTQTYDVENRDEDREYEMKHHFRIEDPIPDFAVSANNAEEESKNIGYFPANYATCILLFKFAMKIILNLALVGLGTYRVQMNKEKKQEHVRAIKIMKILIDFETRYKYSPPGYNLDKEFDIPTTSSYEAQSRDKKEDPVKSVKEDSPILIAARMGIPEMVEGILSRWPVAIQDLDPKGKNVLMLAAENRQTSVFDYLLKIKPPEHVFYQVDDDGNSTLHLAAMLGPWRIPGAALQMQWELKWYQHVKDTIPPQSYAHNNKRGETPHKIFSTSHKPLVKEGTDWLIKASESCSLIAALIATVAFPTSAAVPGGLDQTTGRPLMDDHTAFDVFSICSLVALSLSITALIFFLAIITSSCQEQDFERNLPMKLLMGLTALFSSIAVMLVSFCAGHTFILGKELRLAAVPIYATACVPVSAFFAIVQIPLYFDLLWAACRKLPLRSYKVFYE